MEAAALAEQGVCALGHVAEPLPCLGRFLEEPSRTREIAAGFGELGAGLSEEMLNLREGRVDATDEPLRESRVVKRQSGIDERSELATGRV